MNKAICLGEDEKLLFEEGASHFHNFIAVGGYLKLTTKRIIFTTCSTFNYQHELIINIEELTAVEFFKTMFMNPNGLALMLKDGSMEHFIVDDRKSWRERIQSMLAHMA